MSSDSDSSILVIDEQPQSRLRFSIAHAMIATAAVAVVFAVLGVNRLAAIFIVAFVLSALVWKPRQWQAWLLLSIAAIAASPYGLLLADGYTLAMRVAISLGHWPAYNNPDPNFLPVNFHPQTAWLSYLVPTLVCTVGTCLFMKMCMKLGTWPQRLEIWVLALPTAWGIAFLFWKLDSLGVLIRILVYPDF
jgi:hypothetical protein